MRANCAVNQRGCFTLRDRFPGAYLVGKNRRVSHRDRNFRALIQHVHQCFAAWFHWHLRRRRYLRTRLLIRCKKEVESRRLLAVFAAIGTELAWRQPETSISGIGHPSSEAIDFRSRNNGFEKAQGICERSTGTNKFEISGANKIQTFHSIPSYSQQ